MRCLYCDSGREIERSGMGKHLYYAHSKELDYKMLLHLKILAYVILRKLADNINHRTDR